MKYKACIIGHFGFHTSSLDGQTIKTKILADELERQFGNERILRVDTAGGITTLIRIVMCCFGYFRNSSNIIMLPAQNGVLLFTPLLRLFNILFKRRLHYVVIGGWLPEYLKKHKLTERLLKHFHGIYVETAIMQKALEAEGFTNIVVMPNCKPLKILSESELNITNTPPYRLCTFSRVMEEKGIEDAIEAVKEINETAGKIMCTLDIYGQIDPGYVERFDRVQNDMPEYIRYKGLVDFDKTTEVLKDYYALLFPTYYEGEGFAGTIIDGFAAGLPIIATNWRYNAEIIEQYETGIIYPCDKASNLTEAIKWLLNTNKILDLKNNALRRAERFLPGHVVTILVKELE